MGNVWDIKGRLKNKMATVNGSGRAIFCGGSSTSPVAHKDEIDYINITTTGDAADFGNLTGVRQKGAAFSSVTRGVAQGGYAPSESNVIDYITFSALGNASDFGDLSATRGQLGSPDLADG